jgi:hypothetical protein
MRHADSGYAPPAGWLWVDPDCGIPAEAYVPREGDIVLMTSRSVSYAVLYAMGGATHPFHMGLVVRTSCGELALLESGGAPDKRVSLLPVEARLCEYLATTRAGLIWVRPISGPLCECRSHALTHFAESQVGKEFATVRSAWFVMPGESQLLTSPDQERWFCSEIVIEALRQADLVRGIPRPAAILPQDVFYNSDIDLDFYWLPSMQWTPQPALPARRPLFAPH